MACPRTTEGGINGSIGAENNAAPATGVRLGPTCSAPAAKWLGNYVLARINCPAQRWFRQPKKPSEDGSASRMSLLVRSS
jgi:hypothetical protein